jgi:hypothetical protein
MQINFFQKYKTVLLLALLALITFGIYAGNISNGFGYYDDYREIVTNPLVNPAQTPLADVFKLSNFHFYTPIKQLSNYLLNAASYNNPHLGHLLNDVIHVFNVLLCFLCVLFFTKRYNIAFFSALAFAVNPACSAAVNEIAARGHILSAFFVLSSTYFYLLTLAQGAKFSQVRHFQIFSLIFFILAVLTWPTVILLPLLFISIDFLYKKISFRRLAPFLMAALAACVLNFYISYISGAFNVDGTAFNNDMMFSPVLLGSAIFYKLPLIFSKYVIYCFYPPEADIVFTPFLPAFFKFKTYYILNFTALLALGGIYYKIIKTNKVYAVFLIMPLCFLAPGLVFMYKTELLSLRYIYLPSVGIFAAFFVFISGLTINIRKTFKYAVYASIILWLLFSSANTYTRKYYWKNPYTLLVSLTMTQGIAEVWGWFLKINWEPSLEKKIEYMQTAKNILETKYHTGYELQYAHIMQNLDGRIEAGKALLAKRNKGN